MTPSSAAARAASALREKAERLSASARGKTGEDDRFRRAEALRTIAARVEGGAEALRAALGTELDSAKDQGTGMNATVREIAGRELFALAQRRADAGMQRNLGAPVRPGWERGGSDLPIHRATLREAAELYELALLLHYDDYWNYLRGLLHESLGEFAEAIFILETLDGAYAGPGKEQAARCRRKLDGSFDLRSELNAALGDLLRAAPGNAGLAETMREAFGALHAGLERAKRQDIPAPEAGAQPLESPRLERAERAARDFAEHLANGEFGAARALLARSLGTLGENALSEQYARMMGLATPAGEPARPAGETVVTVMSSEDGMPMLGPRDLGWVYVAMTNDFCNEALTFVVTDENGEARIRTLEWGRP